MTFNSFPFWVFIFVSILIYFTFAKRYQSGFLLLASLTFYFLISPVMIIFPLFVALVTFFAAKFKKLGYLVMGIILSLLPLVFFKYSNVNIFIPIGISFFTFQALSYLFEVYKKNQKLEKDFLNYLSFVMFFPIILSGPIERSVHLLPQLKRKQTFNLSSFLFGGKLIIWGLFKKIVIADRLGVVVDKIFAHPQSYNGFPLLLAAICMVYQLYCDFSGYSDIARGIASMIGFNIINNFNNPFCSKSVSEFWRRWHITLSSWARDYIYTPLLINLRNWGRGGVILVLFITFGLVGIWHGANWTYVVFGLLQAIFISMEVLTQKRRRNFFANVESRLQSFLAISLVLILWLISMIIFRSNNLIDAGYILSHLFSNTTRILNFAFLGQWTNLISELLQNGLGLPVAEIAFTFLAILILEIIQYLNRQKNIFLRLNGLPLFFQVGLWDSLILIIILAGKFGQSQFIYFKF